MHTVRSFLFYASLLAGFLLLVKCKHAPSEENQEEPPVTIKLNEQIAGTYNGSFYCGYYNGMYGTDVYPGTLELLAVGNDSLKVAQTVGCIYFNYAFQYDSIESVGKDYSVWQTGGPYQGMLHFAPNDSIILFVPEHFSIGWLQREFVGKKD